MKKALLVVSFGTVVPQARANIDAVEAALRDAVPQRDFFHAFTSPMLRRILAGRGEKIPGLEEALEQLHAQGYDDVIVQPTYVLYGGEYDKLRETADSFSGSFVRLTLGKPLMADAEDLVALAGIVRLRHPADDALLLLGHGTKHFANMVYPALQTALRLQGCEKAYVGTVKGWPGFEEVLAQLRRDGRREVLIAPLMLAAGGHALRDMAGEDEHSWKSRLEKEHFSVRCHMEGLGALPEVQALYREHLLRNPG